MPVLYEPANPALFKRVKERNLEQQFILLRTAVDVALSITEHRFTADVLNALHASATNYIDDTPGIYRTGSVHIKDSDHVPPDYKCIDNHIADYLAYLNANFATLDAFELAAFAMWRLTWIHPFGEGNGRTARAFAYMVLCIKVGYWLPGQETVLSLMSETKEEMYKLLAEADHALKTKDIFEMGALARYLKELLTAQLEN